MCPPVVNCSSPKFLQSLLGNITPHKILTTGKRLLKPFPGLLVAKEGAGSEGRGKMEAKLEIKGLEELTTEEAEKQNGGALVVLAFAIGFGIGMCYNRYEYGYWL